MNCSTPSEGTALSGVPSPQNELISDGISTNEDAVHSTPSEGAEPEAPLHASMVPLMINQNSGLPPKEAGMDNQPRSRPSSASSFTSTPVLPPIPAPQQDISSKDKEGQDSTSNTSAQKDDTKKKNVTTKKFVDKFHLQEKKLEEVVSGVLECLKRLHEMDEEDYETSKVSNDLTYMKEASRYGERGPVRLAVYEAYKQGKAPELFRRIWKNNFKGNYLTKENRHLFNNMKDILIVLWNGTDMSKPLTDDIVNIKLYEDILLYLSDEKMDSMNLKSPFKKYLIKGLMGITNNVVQMTDCVHSLRQNDAVSIFTKLYEAPDTMVSCKALMVLAYVITEEENEKINGDHNNFKFMVKILKHSMEGEDLHSKLYGFSAHEIVEALNRLAANDGNKVRIVENGVLPLYVALIQPDMPPREQQAAARGIWTLAFVCSKTIKQEPGCMDGQC